METEIGQYGREYIRHPSDIPIVVQPKSHQGQLNLALNNVSRGGLAFDCPEPLNTGSVVSIRIRVVKPMFHVKGIVQWCRPKGSGTEGYEAGVQFIDDEDAFRVRMVEQVCHIEHYKKEVKTTEGRRLTGEKAALEWIAKHGAEFPNPDLQDMAVSNRH
jgi:Tfp pilus assembly protein PilZ